MEKRWIPESTRWVAYYAARHGVTKNLNEALTFTTQEECLQWCNDFDRKYKGTYRQGEFEPRQHGF